MNEDENKKKIAVYVDGFNLYHAIKNLEANRLKWLDLRLLSEKFIDRKTESIEKIYYFSAIATHMGEDSAIRHRAYISALSQFGIEFVPGHFKRKPFKYKGSEIQRHEEKETDVNIGIHIVRDAILKTYDKLLVITNDTDIIPAIKMAKHHNAAIEIKIITPPTYDAHHTLRKVADQKEAVCIQKQHLEKSLLPDRITAKSGKIIKMPDSYR